MIVTLQEIFLSSNVFGSIKGSWIKTGTVSSQERPLVNVQPE